MPKYLRESTNITKNILLNFIVVMMCHKSFNSEHDIKEQSAVNVYSDTELIKKQKGYLWKMNEDRLVKQ